MPYGAHLVAAHQNVDNDRPSLRGCAVGCAVWSRFPLRPPFQDLPAEAASTQRVCVAFTRIGALHVRCVAVYGWPANHAQAKERNEALIKRLARVESLEEISTFGPKASRAGPAFGPSVSKRRMSSGVDAAMPSCPQPARAPHGMIPL